MSDSIIRSAPGKLFIAGEYAVLISECPAVLVAVDRYVTTEIRHREADTCVLRSDLRGGVALHCRREHKRLVPCSGDSNLRGLFAYALSALHIIETLADHRGVRLRPFDMTIRSTLTDEDGRKLGLGSSAAVVVATIDAAAAFYRLDLTRMDRFRVALLAVSAIDPDTSGGDLAASIWGGWIAYTAPDRRAVAGLVAESGVIDCMQQHWPRLSIRALSTPASVTLQVGWTGEPVRTSEKTAHLSRHSTAHRAALARFRDRTTDCVDELTAAVLADDSAHIRARIARCRELLTELDRTTGIGIFTPRLTALCDIATELGGAAKPSGAGGGDCGIAFFDRAAADRTAELVDRWAAAGIHALTVRTHPPREHADDHQP